MACYHGLAVIYMDFHVGTEQVALCINNVCLDEQTVEVGDWSDNLYLYGLVLCFGIKVGCGRLYSCNRLACRVDGVGGERCLKWNLCCGIEGDDEGVNGDVVHVLVVPAVDGVGIGNLRIFREL